MTNPKSDSIMFLHCSPVLLSLLWTLALYVYSAFCEHGYSNLFIQSAVEEVIEFMDEYYLSKEDWDSVIELGLGDNKDDIVLKKISTATKSSLTRKCVVSLYCVGLRLIHALIQGTTRRNIPCHSTRLRSSAKSLERSLLNQRQTLKRLLT